MKICLAQLNLTVGDIDGNIALVSDAYKQASNDGAELVICPEMCIIGYPPEDLIYTPALQQAAMRAVSKLAALTKENPNSPALIVGGVWQEPADNNKNKLYNAAFLLDKGQIAHIQYKHHLPNYGVFDEVRVFANGDIPYPIEWNGYRIGLMICEDMWHDDTIQHLHSNGADILIAINASPYEHNKLEKRLRLAKNIVKTASLPLIYVNQVGGQDELVFDGSSFIITPENPNQIHMLPEFTQHICTIDSSTPQATVTTTYVEDKCNSLYSAMITGLRDYVNKNGFAGVVIGLSGGIDSALTAAIAVDALGPDRVRAVMMPSPYTADISIEDAKTLANNLSIRLDNIAIEQGMTAVENMLKTIGDTQIPTAISRENIQSRLRGLLLMAVSNSTGYLLITTGNKSEMAVGYATLYGDMCGAYSVLKDLYKTEVFTMAKWRNDNIPTLSIAKHIGKNLIPERTISRAPSAELRPDQKDTDSLPEYDILDNILQALVEERKSVKDIVQIYGYKPEIVEKIAKLLYANEYKRRQAPPAVKLSEMSFGRDRRFPLTNRFKL